LKQAAWSATALLLLGRGAFPARACRGQQPRKQLVAHPGRAGRQIQAPGGSLTFQAPLFSRPPAAALLLLLLLLLGNHPQRHAPQAFHDRGKDGVRVLMYEEMAKRLSAPLHIHIGQEDGSASTSYDVYGEAQPGQPIKLIREVTDLYRRCECGVTRGAEAAAAAAAGSRWAGRPAAHHDQQQTQQQRGQAALHGAACISGACSC
jgi:hypothetical protein